MNHKFWQNKSRMKLLGMAALILVLFLGILQITQKKSQSSSSTNTKQQTTVDVLTVPRAELAKRISLTGQTVPEAQVDIAAKYQGKVTAVYAELGQTVTAGQELIIQDTGDIELTIHQNQAAYHQASADAITNEVSFQANYDKAMAAYQLAVTNYQRYKSLYSAGAISRQQLDASEQQQADTKAVLDSLANQMKTGSTPASVESAQAAASKAQYIVGSAEKQRDDLILQAPRSGMIGYRQVEVGNMVQAGQKLLSIVDNSHIYVDCQVSEQDLAALALGMDVNVQIESLGKSFPGKITYISPSIDTQNMAFSLRIALTNPDASLKSGMFAKTIIQAILRPNALVVPKDAVLEKNGKSYVYVITGQNTVEERVVQIGARGDQQVEVLTGLTEGEQIAANNLSRLKNGMAIVPHPVTLGDKGE
ncbi:MAG TPA: efflux RND transporter periplasmic adaptor subunit [Patescibacteria group bacterium]|nr:efflux RND transporter periplasmic adaptor subunit [Patescibacteria group bacterium]